MEERIKAEEDARQTDRQREGEKERNRAKKKLRKKLKCTRTIYRKLRTIFYHNIGLIDQSSTNYE